MTKLSARTAFSGTLADDDFAHIVDKSDTSGGVNGTSFKVPLSFLKTYIGGTIYTADGTLLANRTVSLSTFNLSFLGTGKIAIGSSAFTAVSKLDVRGNISALNGQTTATVSQSLFAGYFENRTDTSSSSGSYSSIQPYGLAANDSTIFTGHIAKAIWTRDTANNLNNASYSLVGLEATIKVSANGGTIPGTIGVISEYRNETAGCTVTLAIGVKSSFSEAISHSGTTTEFRGFYIPDQSAISGIAATRYGLYFDDAVGSYMSGQIGLGILPIGTTKIYVKGSDATSSNYGIQILDSALVTNFVVRNDGVVYSKLGYWIENASSSLSKILGNNKNDTNTIAGINSAHGISNTYGNITYVGGQAFGARTGWGSDNQIAGIGYDNLTTPTGGTGWFVLGTGCNTEAASSYNHILLLASGAKATASNQMVVGGQFSRIDECWFGGGVWQTSNSNFSDFKLSVAGIKAGTANTSAAANGIIIAGAVGTGTGTGGDVIIQTAKSGGAGSSRNALADVFRATQGGNQILGSQVALATNASDGFTYIPTCAGTPTGTPTTYTGKSPLVIDSTNNIMYIYSGGAWVALN